MTGIESNIDYISLRGSKYYNMFVSSSGANIMLTETFVLLHEQKPKNRNRIYFLSSTLNSRV